MADGTLIAAKSARAPAAENNDKPFGWRFVTPLFMGSTLNPINSTLMPPPWSRLPTTCTYRSAGPRVGLCALFGQRRRPADRRQTG